MSYGEKLVVSYLTKIRVEFINQVTDCKLRKNRTLSPPEIWWPQKKAVPLHRHSEIPPTLVSQNGKS